MLSPRNTLLCVFVVFILTFHTSCSTDNAPTYTVGDELMEMAEAYEQKAYYHSAEEYYVLARKAFLEEGNEKSARFCRWKTVDMQKITETYNIPQDKLFEVMKHYNENYNQGDLNTWLAENRLVHMIMDGVPWYFESCFTNLSYFYPDVMERDHNLQASINMFTGLLLYFLNNRQESEIVHSNPRRYEASHTIEIPRDKLPQSGTLKIWLPFPIETHGQTDIEILSITPKGWHKQGPDIYSDIGCVYFEIPLDQFEPDLYVEVRFRFNHYETRYSVDTGKVEAYDKNSEIYKKYTGETENTVITPGIRQKAAEILGDETNPYLQARLIYRYIVENIRYGLTPHNANEALKHPTSVFVHDEGYGDCGAHAIYFTALCRAVGIPARSTGGNELIVPGGSGHIWAEYYIPGYGWIPVDPSLGVVVSLSRNTDVETREMMIDYLGGNLDPYRLIFQNDTDLSIVPPEEEPSFFGVSFQSPRAECREMEEIPSIMIIDHHKWKVEALDVS